MNPHYALPEFSMRKSFLALPLLLALAGPAFAADELVKVSAADAGRALDGPKAVTVEREGLPIRWLEMLKSTDGTLSAGIARVVASRSEIKSYEADEFMYFLKGGVTLTSADGTVTKVVAGDALTIPRGWKGVWDTQGYTKYFVGNSRSQ
jgi:uncharacterized cupin superfamily protein